MRSRKTQPTRTFYRVSIPTYDMYGVPVVTTPALRARSEREAASLALRWARSHGVKLRLEARPAR